MILIDTDVLLDVAFDREPHAAAAAELLPLLETRRRSAFVAWHTLSNFLHLARPVLDTKDTRRFLADLTQFARVALCDAEGFCYALSLDTNDLEDAMQVAAAWACGARWIATRNVADLRRPPFHPGAPSCC